MGLKELCHDQKHLSAKTLQHKTICDNPLKKHK